MLAVYMALLDEEDEDIFEKLYYKYRKQLYTKARSILNDHHLAEEAVSDAFLSLAKNFKKVNKLKLSEIVAFLIIINRNTSLQIYNREKKIREAELSDEFIEQKTDDFYEIMKNRPIFDAVRNLPDKFRDVIMLKYYYELTVEEISKTIGLSVGGVKYRLKEAKRLLREELSEYERGQGTAGENDTALLR